MADSHISETSVEDTSLLQHDAPDSLTSPDKLENIPAARPLRLYGKAPARSAEERREVIALPHATSEEGDLDAMPVDDARPTTQPDDDDAPAPVSSPSEASSDAGDFDMEEMRRKMGLGRNVEELDLDIAEGRIQEDDLRGLFDEELRPPTPQLSRSRSTKDSSSPRSPVSSDHEAQQTGRLKKRKIAAIRDSDDEEDGRSPVREVSTEEIVVDVTSSPRKPSTQKKRPLVLAKNGSDEDEERVERPKSKLKGLSKKEREEMDKEVANLKRNRPTKLHVHRGELSMQGFLSSVKEKASKPLTARAARFSTPALSAPKVIKPKSTHAHSTPAASEAPDATAFEDLAEQNNAGGESLDVRFLQTQTYAPVRTKPINRTFAETDPIESSAEADSKMAVSDDDELPDANEAAEKIMAAQRERERLEAERVEQERIRREKAAKLAQLKKRAANRQQTVVSPKKKLAISSEGDDIEIIAPPTLNAAQGYLDEYNRGLHRSTGHRHVERTESQLDRASKTFGQVKAQAPVSHSQLTTSLLGRSRIAALEARQKKELEWQESVGQLHDTPAVQPEATQDAPDIAALLEKKRAEGAEDSDEAEEDDDGDFNPDADEDVEMNSGDEKEGEGDEYGSADEQAFDILPDTPAKGGTDGAPRSPSARSSTAEAPEEADKENSFADMQPLARLDDRRNLFAAAAAAARPALTQLTTGITAPSSPTQVVDAPAVIVPFDAGSPIAADAFGSDGDGFSQLFAEEEKADGPNVFEARPETHFLPTQMQHPGRALLPAFEGNAVLDDLVNSQLEKEGPLNAIHATPVASQRQWLNDDGLLTQHKPADVFAPTELSPDPFFARRLQPTESITSESQHALTRHSSPSHTPTVSPSASPVKKVPKRIMASDDEDDADNEEEADEELPDATSMPVEPAAAPDAFAVMQRAAEKQAARAQREAKRREMNGFFEEQAERSDEEGRDRYGQGLFGNDEDENDEGSDDDGKDLEDLVHDEAVAPELQNEQDRLAEEKHKQHLAADEARLEKGVNKIVKGQVRRKQAHKNSAFDSDSDVDENIARERNRNIARKRKDDDGTMDSLAANEATKAFALGYAETHNPTEVVDFAAFLQDAVAKPAGSDGEEDVPAPRKPVGPRVFKPPRIQVSEVRAEIFERTESLSLVGFVDEEEEEESQRSMSLSIKPRKQRNALNGTDAVSDLYITAPKRTFTSDQKKEALESQGSYGDGRRAGASRTSAVTSFRGPAKGSAMAPPPPRSVSTSALPTKKSNGISTGAGVPPVKSRSLGATGKGRFA